MYRIWQVITYTSRSQMYSVTGTNQDELSDRNLLAYQAKAIAQLFSSRIVSNIRYSQANNSSPEIPTQSTEGNQVRILKDTNNKNDTPSHIRHFNILNELLDLTEEQGLKNHLCMHEHDLTMYQDETAIACISFSIY